MLKTIKSKNNWQISIQIRVEAFVTQNLSWYDTNTIQLYKLSKLPRGNLFIKILKRQKSCIDK